MYIFQFDPSGTVQSRSRYDHPPYPNVESSGLTWVTHDDSLGQADDLRRVKATVQGGQIVGVVLDPAWRPPDPAPDPIATLTAKVEELAAKIDDMKGSMDAQVAATQALNASMGAAQPAREP
jgi:hypothetical protein